MLVRIGVLGTGGVAQTMATAWSKARQAGGPKFNIRVVR
jgi:predicted dehydrogenase